MANYYVNQTKTSYKKKKKEDSALVRELKKHQTKPKFDNIKVETEDKIKSIEYFNNLSEGEKEAFKKQLELKKVRDNYLYYLKYIYGDNYKITRFHTILAKICDNVVKRVEKGEKVRLLLTVGSQHGKGYPVDFPVLTTKGWKKHGELIIGDYVYNDKGEQVKVLGNQNPYMHPCMKVTFANGESHIVTREHLWKIISRYKIRKKLASGIVIPHNTEFREEIIETKELQNKVGSHNKSIAVLMNKPLQNENKELLINPYVLGLWLGDGCSANSEITCSDLDLPNILEAIGDKEHYIVVKKKGNPNVSYIVLGNKKRKGHQCGFTNDFRERLHLLGTLHNKNIPIDYLLASEEQRWELLQGLMDTDGSCDTRGNCEFCNTNKELAYNVYTLLHSLGIKARIGEYDAKLYGRFISKKYRVNFNPNKTDIIFKLTRKQDRVINNTQKDRNDKFKYFIKSIEPVEEHLVSCISVEGGMYLAGKELIPTHNSMTVTETLPSWFIGRNPDLRCIVTAYNADVAEKFGDRNRQKIKDFGKEVFNVEISDSQDNKTLWDIKGHQGGLLATGLNGSLTSNNGALIIVDDPFKNDIEANNQNIREQVWSNFRSSVMTRQRGMGNAIIVIHTRWHDDDLIGKILKSEDADRWTYVEFPCVWEKGIDKLLHRKIGETLCPEIGYDAEWASSMKKMLGAKMFNTIYQCRPYTENGEIVKIDHIKRYTKASLPSVFEEITMSCDLATGTKKSFDDPSGISVWGRVGGNHYLLDYCIKKMSFTDTLERIRFYCNKYPFMKKKIIESRANGNATIELLNKEIGGFVGFNPTESKETRLQLVLPFLEAGNVFFPDESIDRNIEEQIQIILKFPKVSHEEIVDMMTQYLLNYQYKYSGKIDTNNSFSKIANAIRGLKI